MENETLLYIVKEGDTLDSIAKHCFCSVPEILHLNPIAKYRLLKGQPLIVIKKQQEKREEIKDNFKKNSQKIHDLLPLIFYVREILFSSFYYPNATITLKKKCQDMLSEFLEQNNIESADTKQFISTFFDELIYLCEVIKRKDENLLVDYERRIRTLGDQFANLISKNYSAFERDTVKKTIRILMDRYQLFALKIYAQKFDEAEIIFQSFRKDLLIL